MAYAAFSTVELVVKQRWWQVGPKGLFLVLSACASSFACADGIPSPLPGATSGDPQRGRAIVADRHVGLCLLCHTAPIPEERFQGDLAPSLAGAGARWTIPQLRLRIADSSRVSPGTIMPSYYRTDGLARVAPAYQGKPILSAQQIEDVVAYLSTLKDTR